MYKYLFGPVNSRRLGMSLGIDMVPFKTCSFNCIFCQLGCTPQTTLIRKEYTQLSDIESELKDWLAKGASADYITLGGSGEPTLHSGIGKLISIIHGLCRIKVAVLTNSSLLWDENVRASVVSADLVKASLSAFDDESLRRINMPVPGIDFGKYYQGIVDFRRMFKGVMWLEVFLLKGINDRPDDVKKLAELAVMVGADRIQLNTVTRPPAHGDAGAVPYGEMLSMLPLFGKNTEIIADQKASGNIPPKPLDEAAIVALAKRHPVRISDICALFGCAESEAAGLLNGLAGQCVLTKYTSADECYYADPSRK